jgi:hypothetical protein
MNTRLKTALIIAVATAIGSATVGANAAFAASQTPWCAINHVPWFLPCK